MAQYLNVRQRKLSTMVIQTVHILQYEIAVIGSLSDREFLHANPPYFQIRNNLARQFGSTGTLELPGISHLASRICELYSQLLDLVWPASQSVQAEQVYNIAESIELLIEGQAFSPPLLPRPI